MQIKTNYGPVLLPECSDIINIPFAEEYPIMKKHVQFTVRRGTAISAISTNGAPKIKLVSEPKGRSQTYVAEGEMFEDDTLNNRYAYGLQSAPKVKFQICATGGMKQKYDHFIGEPGEIKAKVENAEFNLLCSTHIFTDCTTKVNVRAMDLLTLYHRCCGYFLRKRIHFVAQNVFQKKQTR